MVTVIDFRPGADRTATRAEGRTTLHAFSFGAHYDPGNTDLGALVAHNEEVLPPGTGYAAHHHADLEIVTWVLQGSLRHTSTVGTNVIGPGQVQRLSAGSGVVHAEVADGADQTRFLQAWVRPDEPGLEPDYLAADVPVGPGWRTVAGVDGVVSVQTAGAALHVADLAGGARLGLPDAARLHVFVARGRVLLGERLLTEGDAARLVDEPGRPVSAEADSHLVVWSFRG